MLLFNLILLTSVFAADLWWSKSNLQINKIKFIYFSEVSAC